MIILVGNMLKENIFRCINIVLRGMTLVSKFILIFFLAKFLVSGEVGLFGLLSATVGYALYVVGFEFYNFSTREMIGEEPKRWLGMIRDQLVLYIILYVVFLPFALFVFFKGWLPWTHVYWFITLALLEHIAQELNRILVAVSEQLLASVVLFLRSGAWCLVVVAVMWVDPASRNLEFVLGGWVLGCFFACAIAIKKVLSFDKASLKDSVNWSWIARGIKIAIPLLIASLAIRGIFTFDRYWVESVSGLSVLGAYVLYVGMATAVLSFIDAGVIVFFYPKLVSSAKKGDTSGFKKDMKDLTINIIGVTAFLILACYGVSGFVLQWLNNSVYSENVSILYWLLAAIAIYSVSMIPHLGLYSFGYDTAISYSQVAGFFAFLVVAYLFSNKVGVVSIPLGMCVAFTLILGWKSFAYWAMLRKKTMLETTL